MGNVSLDEDRAIAKSLSRELKVNVPVNSVIGVTPMMAQYTEIKLANPDSLLFYRMGDFYELFFDDAEIASRALGIALTKRGKYCDKDVPMCGVPVHASDDYLHRLIRLGHRVAICEQLEDPAEAKKRGAKSVVRRDVVRLVTPGTLTEDTLLEARQSNYLVSLACISVKSEKEFALSWLDISDGSFHVTDTTISRLDADLSRISPSEIIVLESLLNDAAVNAALRSIGSSLTPLPRAHFDIARSERLLCDYFGLSTLDSHGNFSRVQISAAGALMSYIDMTQVGCRPSITPLHLEASCDVMRIDRATRMNLEITRTSSGKIEGSLLSVIDHTLTSFGARLLSDRLSNPLTNASKIRDRLDCISFFLSSCSLCDKTRNILKSTPDMVRALSRLSFGRGGPRDLCAILSGMSSADMLIEVLKFSETSIPCLIKKVLSSLSCINSDLISCLRNSLIDNPPVLIRDGGFIRAGHCVELDEARLLRDESRKIIASLQVRYIDLSGIRQLKIKHNNMLGYFVEVSVQHSAKLLEDSLKEIFIHRQTMSNCLRFSTVELKELEARISLAAERALSIEKDIFESLCQSVLAQSKEIKLVSFSLAEIDVYSSLSVLATKENYSRPCVDDSLSFSIDCGSHPVVKSSLESSGDSFIGNNCDLSPPESDGHGVIWLITGPNMAGKSTFLRQNALISILAQMGSYVPAHSAHIGIIDQLFSRVGASDDLARGRSTFMVEMVETASILNQAGSRSLVILDEIGRGTATFDGLSIAWACVEHLHAVNKTRALFATHFHELTHLSHRLDRIVNATVRVREWNDDIVFLYEVIPGTADRSYGIHVARRAGLPPSVIDRARLILDMLENGKDNKFDPYMIDNLPLFSNIKTSSSSLSCSRKIDDLLAQIDRIIPDDLTPKDALEFIYHLKKISMEGLDSDSFV